MAVMGNYRYSAKPIDFLPVLRLFPVFPVAGFSIAALLFQFT